MNNRFEGRSPLSDVERQIEESEALIWDLLDDELDEANFARLVSLLEENSTVRSRYVDCVQLHVDLQEYFGQKALDKKQLDEKQHGSTPVVANALPGLTGLPGFPTLIQ
ncbi:hypothetical protein [Lacipirellula sp.]|uniref:hypothetical protein n=1 Tax=Lacipirellula sp. TaxID=2691419 RepID=UPI003D143CBF